ncbi:MAG: hypothetical protein DMD74_04430 [Gemmatimonadetes bacterium]|nr:MAG: hypothetical protein DMD74_04430 [Gemmatimonadota bacterium]
MADAGRRAAFLDRDGTILEDPGFLHQPGKARLLPGAGAAVRRLNDAGVLVVTVSNQSGIARGLHTAADYHAVQRRLAELLAAPPYQAHLDGAYFCPHHPEVTGPCDCRKPGTRLFEEARAALGIDFACSFFIGDRLSDVGPARTLGGTGFLVLTGEGEGHRDQARVLGVTVVADLAAAVREILGRP